MQLEKIVYALSGAYPVLELTIDGQEAVCMAEAKGFVVEHKLVYLGWEDELPEITVPEDRVTNRSELTLRGFTDDLLIFQIWEQFAKDANTGNFSKMLGDRPIPKLKSATIRAI